MWALRGVLRPWGSPDLLSPATEKHTYSRWTKKSNPATRAMLNPRTPKSQCFSACVTKSDVRVWFLSSIGRMHFRYLQVTLTLNLGGQIEGVWIFRPSTVPTGVCGMPRPPVGTVSLSDVFTSFGLQTLLWKHHSACCWSYSKLRKTLPFHK